MWTPEERLAIAREIGIQVDPEDEWLLSAYTWGDCITSIRTTIPTTGERRQLNFALHHCIVGQPIDGSVIDHIDRNIYNNRRDNLRYTSYSNNIINSNRVEGAENISLTRHGRYRVRLMRARVYHTIGNFVTYQEAVEARDAWLSKQEMCA